MKDKNTYTGTKVKNQFTSYLLSFIRGKRRDYLEKKIKISSNEEFMEDFAQVEIKMTFDEIIETQARESVLLFEANGKYPIWDQMMDQRLVETLTSLRDEERHLIYQHVFEERPFKEISLLNGISEKKCKGIYYYAIKKIRDRMRGKKHEF